jgi:hypothetical protein
MLLNFRLLCSGHAAGKLRGQNISAGAAHSKPSMTPREPYSTPLATEHKMSRGLVNGLGGTVLGDPKDQTKNKWMWPENPTEPRDIIATFVRNWGRDLAYSHADNLIAFLAGYGVYFCRAYQDPGKPFDPDLLSVKK